jgi:hypothetical protein
LGGLDASDVGSHDFSQGESCRVIFTGEYPLSRFEAAEGFGNVSADAVEVKNRPHFGNVRQKVNVHHVDYTGYTGGNGYTKDTGNLDKMGYSVNMGN